MDPDRFDIARFLREHWQRKPVLVRNPWRAWSNPLAPDALAGLACEEGVESRLIVPGARGSAVEHGPIAERRFAQLPDRGWTLLVQAVDQHVPQVAALLEAFRFVPNWRIDDVMVSYAADGGGVGPHFDQYDVFLIQGMGRRRWQIGAPCDAASPLAPHDDLRLLAGFEATHEWVLEPGDMLYVPPGVAHNGIAVGDDCMTYSIGFRAPSRQELIEHWTEHLLADLPDEDRHADPGLQPQENPGEITADALARLHAMVTESLADRDAFARWFGLYNSAPKYPDIDWRPEQPIDEGRALALVAQRVPLCRNPASRFSFVRERSGSILLFVDGRSFECRTEAAALAEQLCARPSLIIGAELMKSAEAMALIVRLAGQGSVAFVKEEGQ
jgi:50S ribosomal protein L16 3-hydroxylase